MPNLAHAYRYIPESLRTSAFSKGIFVELLIK